MAHFAQIAQNNTVIRVIVVDNRDTLDENGVESEAVGVAFCQKLLGVDTRWVQTSYNSNFRARYAGIGFVWRPDLSAFIAPQPYPSWTLNQQTTEWEAPVSPPNLFAQWDEATRSWIPAP